MPSSYIRTRFFFPFFSFHFQVLLKSPNHGFHSQLKRLPAPRRRHGPLGTTVARSRTHHSIHCLPPLGVTTLFLSELDPSIIKPVFDMSRCCSQTKEKLFFWNKKLKKKNRILLHMLSKKHLKSSLFIHLKIRTLLNSSYAFKQTPRELTGSYGL